LDPAAPPSWTLFEPKTHQARSEDSGDARGAAEADEQNVSAWLADRSRTAWSMLALVPVIILLPGMGLLFGRFAPWILGAIALALFGALSRGWRREGR